ncbi:hypothetical protein EDC01DRAFT_625886 [Geopyxis carbonaria]|nr:hypothetical protein EDC01DRAFT_625886 [Geopyxis carbonaria]
MTPTFPSSSLPGSQHQNYGQQQQRQGQAQPSAPIDHLQYTAHHDQTTLVLGVLNYLERLEHEIAEMREFVNLGFKKFDGINDMDGGLASRVETQRLQSRNWNRANVTELDEQFRILPRSTGEYPNDVPSTGGVLRDSPHKVIDHILDMYDIPFIPTMFLVEKKMLYLRFLGANRIVMHRILD